MSASGGRDESSAHELEERAFRVPDMDCPSCAQKVENALTGVDAVTRVETQPTTGQVSVTHTSAVDSDALVATIATAGYNATPVEEGLRFESPQEIWRTPRGIATFAGGVLLTAGMILHFGIPGSDLPVFDLAGRAFHVSHVLFLLSAALAGAPILRNGYYSARNWSLDIDFLMSAGIIGSVGTHHPFEGAMLAVLFSIAQLLERYSMDRARGSLRELMELSPEVATVRRNGDEKTVPVKAVEVGETVVVRPGEKIPVDGVVTEGTSAVNQAPITGESAPVNKSEGEEVYAGTINEEGYLEVTVSRTSSESTIARIIQLVEDAQREKTVREQFVDRLASVYTPLVVSIAVVVTVVPPLGFGASWNTWFLRGLTLLVIACPCAFVISTPVSVVSGITSAAKNGVLIKSGRDLEAVGDTGVVALDKTGTVTRGQLTVTDVVPVKGVDEADVVRRASLLERRSEHPIAEAIVEHAERHSRPSSEVSDRTSWRDALNRTDTPCENAGAVDSGPAVERFEALPGKGVSAEVDGVEHFVGKPALFEELGFGLEYVDRTPDGGVPVSVSRTEGDRVDPDEIGEVLHRFESDGKSVVLVGTERALLGVIVISDEPRSEAAWAVSKLKEQDIHVVMLTGDNEGTARAVAESVGIDEYYADLLPEEKLDRISELEAEYEYVTMVGDGINDAPAMASSTVGIAMGAAGTDTALETANIALMGDDLTRLPYLYRLSSKSNGVIRQNIWSSLGVKAVLALGAPFGIVTVIHAVVIGDMGMSLAVTGNAMRLSEVEPEAPDADTPFDSDENAVTTRH